jgi:hypothetical protein
LGWDFVGGIWVGWLVCVGDPSSKYLLPCRVKLEVLGSRVKLEVKVEVVGFIRIGL